MMSAALLVMDPDEWSTCLLWVKLIVPLDNVESIRHRDLSTRYSDGLRMDMNVDTDRLHSDNSMTRVVRPLDDDPKAQQLQWRLDASMPRAPPSTTRGLDDSMACGRSDGATTRCPTTRDLRSDSRTRWFNGLRTIRWRDDTSRGSRSNSRTW